jgi:hypothetical protein
MGWNDHDDRLMVIADILEGAGMGYDKAYEMALEIRTDELCGEDWVSEESLMQYAYDLMEEEEGN